MGFCRKVFVISAKQATVLVVPTVVVILRCFLCDSWLDVLSFGFSTLVRRVHVFYRLSTGQSLLGRCLRCWRCSLPVGIIAISARHASFCSQVGSQSGQVLFCLYVCSCVPIACSHLFSQICSCFLQARQPSPAEQAPEEKFMGSQVTPFVLCLCGMCRVGSMSEHRAGRPSEFAG